MDGWKGNRKFWAGGSVFATVDLIWVTLCYRKLAEELGDPPPPHHWRSGWKGLAHVHIQNTLTHKPSIQVQNLIHCLLL